MKRNNYIIAILNIIFVIISILSRTILENNNMIGLVKPTVVSYLVEIIFILIIIYINIYAFIKNSEKMKKILLINILMNSINGAGLFLTGIGDLVTSDGMYLLFDVIICIDFILSIAIIVINKHDINDAENNKNINFKVVLLLEILFSIILLVMFINSINFHKINMELNKLNHERYSYDNTTSEKIKKFKEYENNGKYGVKNDKNKIIVNAEYEYVSKFIIQDNLFYGYKKHSIDVYNDDGQRLGTYKDSIFFHYFKAYDSFSASHSILTK